MDKPWNQIEIKMDGYRKTDPVEQTNEIRPFVLCQSPECKRSWCTASEANFSQYCCRKCAESGGKEHSEKCNANNFWMQRGRYKEPEVGMWIWIEGYYGKITRWEKLPNGRYDISLDITSSGVEITTEDGKKFEATKMSLCNWIITYENFCVRTSVR